MGALYLGTEMIAGRKRRVVIKEMLDYFDPADPQGQVKAVNRFQIEAATLASLNIHGIPQVFDFFNEGGRNFIVMQFIEGQNLEQGLTHYNDQGVHIVGKPYPNQNVRQWGTQLCKILDNLASENVIHMDIKPANLIVDKTGGIWLVDFGTVKTHQFTPTAGKTGIKKSSVYGTLGYAPPEQATGKPEARSDVFALAATLYHLLTDDDPRDNPYKFPKLSIIPHDLRNALEKALVQDVNKRISAKKFAELLEVQTPKGPVFRWRDGSVSNFPEDLTSPADQNWQEARMYFSGDDWRRWFKDLHRNDLLREMEQAKKQEDDLDLALDMFLRYLNPTLPEPRLDLSTTTIDADEIAWGKQKSVDLEIYNAGGGCLRAVVSNVSPGLEVNTLELAVHNARRLTVTIDADKLSPQNQPHSLYLTIDAGKAGLSKVKINVVIPEPVLQIDPQHLKLASSFKGDVLVRSITVSNQGGSACIIDCHSKVEWAKLEPSYFLCSPGNTYTIKLTAYTHRLHLGFHTGSVHISAKADEWDLSTQLPIRLSISIWQYFRKNWARPLLWISAWIIYGVFSGSVLGSWFGRAGVGIHNIGFSVLTGILLGTFICVLLPTIIGGFGGFQIKKGRQGARLGALLGVGPGVIIGGLAGFLGFRFLTWLGFSLETGFGMGSFSAIVGGLACLALGIITWRLSER